jgi:RluA family pseudouridine synthase
MARDFHVPIIWRDEDLLVIDKPAGLLSVPDGYDPALPYIKSELEPEFGSLWIVHRLDRQTSGVMVLARNPQAHRHLNYQFQERQVKKIYHAIVLGDPPWEQKLIKLPLRIDGDRQHRTVVDKRNGIPAITNLRVLERFRTCCLVEAAPMTGRRHQIRAHLTAEGAPILGDELYGKSMASKLTEADYSIGDNQKLPITRLALHAWSIYISHPNSAEAQTFQAPYPADFVASLEHVGA